MTTPAVPAFTDDRFSVVSARDSRTERLVRSRQKQGSALVILLFLFVVALLPFLFYTYWVFLEAAVRAWHLPTTRGILTSFFGYNRISPGGWPFDAAFVLSTLTVWSILYLGYDSFSLFGNRAIKAALLRKSRAIYPYTLLQSAHYFVEVRPPDDVARARQNRLMPDIGWLFLTPDALVFAGNEQVATIPRERMREANRSVRTEISRFGLSASSVKLPYGSRRSETVQVMVRDDAARLSDTKRGALHLEKALNDWLNVEGNGVTSSGTTPP